MKPLQIVISTIEEEQRACQEYARVFSEHMAEAGLVYAAKWKLMEALEAEERSRLLNRCMSVLEELCEDEEHPLESLEILAQRWTRDLLEIRSWMPNSSCPASNLLNLATASAKSWAVSRFLVIVRARLEREEGRLKTNSIHKRIEEATEAHPEIEKWGGVVWPRDIAPRAKCPPLGDIVQECIPDSEQFLVVRFKGDGAAKYFLVEKQGTHFHNLVRAVPGRDFRACISFLTELGVSLAQSSPKSFLERGFTTYHEAKRL